MKRLCTTLLSLVLAVACNTLSAAPRMFVTQGAVTITLYDEPCAMTDVVANLPYRAVWLEGAKQHEGCYTVFGGAAVGAYFDDQTVAVIPAQMFQPVQEI